MPKLKLYSKNHVDCKNYLITQPKVNTKKEDFEKAVEKAKEYVTAGDIFQVVLSKRYQFQIKGDLIPFYESLRTINPSPYMYFYKSGERQIVGSSPEMLVRVENRHVETFPIAGTKPSHTRPQRKQPLSHRACLLTPKNAPNM